LSLDRVDPAETRAAYDAVAARYAEEIGGELDGKPFDREFLDKFAASVAGSSVVAELGCGPGHVAAYLAERGVQVVGLDLSPNMVAQAQRLFPGGEFVVGDMLDLPFEDGSLAGVVAFYSIIHFDDSQLALAFGEMRRVLVAEGLAAFAFHIGDEVLRREEWWGTPVTLDARFLDPGRVTKLLEQAGFAIVRSQERAPYAPEIEYQSRRTYIVARPVLTLPGSREELPPFGLGYPRTDLRRNLVAAVLRGEKVGTAGLARHFAPHTHEPVPKPGDRWVLLGYEDEPVAIVETTRVDIVRAGQVDLDFAKSEGEGFESAADWRAAHERFWHDEEITDDTEILCERFRVVEVF
jgi:uncharacterized protein YhfF